MGKFTNLNRIKNQAELTETLEGREAAKKLPGIANGCAQADKYGV